MRDGLIPEGTTLLALALLSRGRMTAPRALVAYRTPEHGCCTAEVNLQRDVPFHYGTHWQMCDVGAMGDFRERLERDHTYYVEKGVPLTDESWIHTSERTLEEA